MEIKVTDTTYVRDTRSNALVNKDIGGLNDYKMKRKLAEAQKHEINNVKKQMESIKSDVEEIKELMRQLLNKGSNG